MRLLSRVGSSTWRNALGRGVAVGALLGLGVGACLAEPEQQQQHIGELRDLYRDLRGLDLGDLLSYPADFATEAMNDALASADYASIELGETEIYALSEDAAGDGTLRDLDELTAGLVDRYGYKALTTEVNLLRQSHLESSPQIAYAESAFVVDGGHDWGYAAGGFDDDEVHVEFLAEAQLSARVIRAVDRELDAYRDAPLAAFRESRGFVLPRSVSDFAGPSSRRVLCPSGQGPTRLQRQGGGSHSGGRGQRDLLQPRAVGCASELARWTARRAARASGR